MTADVLTLSAPSGATAEIAPHRGFNLYRLALPPVRPADGDSGEQTGGGPVEVIAAEPAFPAGGKPSHSGVPLLFPFPNRIKAGEFVTEQQRSHILPLGDGPGEAHSDGAGNAIHGFAFDRAWTVAEQTERSAAASFTMSENDPDRAALWPGDGRLTVRYELTDVGLRCDLTVENLSEEPLPFGLGTHPYFVLPIGAAGTAADCTVTVPAAARHELIGGVPTGQTLDVKDGDDLRHGPAFGGLNLDDVYTRVAAKADEPDVIESSLSNPANGLRIVQRCDAAFREQVVFTPPWFREGDAAAPTKAAVCIEPYTCATDAVNLDGRGVDAGWRTLQPGGRFDTWFEIAVIAG